MFRPSLALAIVFMLSPPVGASAQDATTSAKSQTTNARAAGKDRRTRVQRRAGFRAETPLAQRTCGQCMYFKNDKCNDAGLPPHAVVPPQPLNEREGNESEKRADTRA